MKSTDKRITIINGDADDDTVIVDGVPKDYSLAGLVEDRVWAVQWYGDKGEVEYNDGSPNEIITDMLAFNKVLNKFEELEEEGNPPLTKEQEHKLKVLGINANAKYYLASTDWYVVRYMETGEPIPEEILVKRAKSRASISA